MPSGSRCKPGALGDRANHVSLNLDGRRRGRKGGELRIKRCSNPVGALRGEGRSGIEQAEVARMIYMDESMLHLRDGPFQRLLQGLREVKIKLRKLAAEDLKVMGGNDGSFGEALHREKT